MSASGMKALPRRILLATKDPLLRETRKLLVAGFGFYVEAPNDQRETQALIQSESFDLLILGNTLDPETIVGLAAEYRKQQPHGRIIEIVDSAYEEPVDSPDAIVVALDGPLALQHVIEGQLRIRNLADDY
jgi:CheY-like chemotaxis protein